MSSVSQIVEALQELLNERANILAKETGFIQRVRTFTGADFAQAMIFGWLHAQAVDIGLLRHFSAVYVEDSSSILLPEQLSEVWRGCGGSQGTSTAALKLFARWDVLNGKLDGPVLTDGRHSDKRSPLPLEDLPDGCLYIADLGFWGVARFSQIARRGQGRQKRRYLLSRLPVRVCIERVPREVGDQRRQEIRENAQDHGRVPSEEVLYRADWTLIISNLPTCLVPFEQVLILLRLRWQIERLFRLWKEYGHVDESRSSNPWRMLTEIYSKLAAMVIQQWLLHEGCWQDPHRSLLKAAQIVRREASVLMRALSKGELEEVLTDIIGYMRSGCRMNRRKLRPNTSQFLMGEPHRWPVRKELARP